MSINYLDILLHSMATRLQQRLQAINPGRLDEVLMIGIHTGGVWVAEHLHQLLALPTPLGQLNIAFYRDDFTRIGLHPRVKPSQLPLPVSDQHIVLVDDVLHTGRTIRAALNEIFDYGRPARITLVVLLDRNGRELPIQADIVGFSPHLQDNQHIKLCGPHPLSLEIRNV